MTPELLDRLNAAARARRMAILATRLSDGMQHLLCEDEPVAGMPEQLRLEIPERLRPKMLEAMRGGRSQAIEIEGSEWFVHVHAPPPRLLVVGAVHIAQALAPLARMVGLDVMVIDPRRSFATADRFPGVALMHRWPDEALREIELDRHSAVVTLTHDPKLDDPALAAALRGPAFYIGALGSRRTHAGRLDRLRDAGFDEAALGRVKGPVGLAIGAIGAQEIALSILAELVAVRRGAMLGARSK